MAQLSAAPSRIQEAATIEETLARMRAKLGRVVPEADLSAPAEAVYRINQLKRERNALILCHNYMGPVLYHCVPDHVGDSLELSRLCVGTSADIILFCGVLFMAETAKVLNPDKTVLIPDLEAGCTLAAGITPEAVRALKRVYPGAPVITYINTYAAVKAESDCCCTSGNAAGVVRHYLQQGHDRIIFLPDEFLARNTAKELGAAFTFAPESLDDAPENAGVEPGPPTVIGWRVRCEVHEQFNVGDVEEARRAYPDVVILAHPECPPEVVALCDVAGSTKRMLDYIRDVPAPRYLLLTESAMTANLAAMYPDRQFVLPRALRCPHMDRITVAQTLAALENIQCRVELDPDIIARARTPIDRMLQIR